MQDSRFTLKPHYSNSRALVIGINNYKNVSPLSYAVSDASEIRDILINELNFDPSNVTYLSDKNATKANIEKEFLKYTKDDVGFDERIILFYAGHGHTKTGLRGEIGYLVPFDAEISELSTLIRWDDLTKNTELIPAKHMLFIMDACYGGLALTRNSSEGTTRFLRDMMVRQARQVLTAGKADEVVADSGGPLPNHSIFTGHLIQGLKGAAATSNGVITANSLMAYVYSKVATDKNSHQTPHYGYFDGDGDFILNDQLLNQLEVSETRELDSIISIPYFTEISRKDSTASKMKRVKELLSSEIAAIELNDYLINELKQVMSSLSNEVLPVEAPYSVDEFINRLNICEESCHDFSMMIACTAQWATPIHTSTLQKIFARSCDTIEHRTGLSIWLALRWYPLIIELYSSGIAAIDGQRLDNLATIFKTEITSSEYRPTKETFIEGVSRGISDLSSTNLLKQIPGHEKFYAPLSEYLFKKLQPQLEDTLFLGKNYEQAFDSFEVLFALSVADLYKVKHNRLWAPIGRFGWKYRSQDGGPLQKLINEANEKKSEWPPLKAGLFGGDLDRFNAVSSELIKLIHNLNWF